MRKTLFLFSIILLFNYTIEAKVNSPNNLAVTQHTLVEDCSESIQGFQFLGTYANNKYFLSEDIATWRAAQTIANDVGGYLVSINDQNEQDFITSNLDVIAFIGYADEDQNGSYTLDSEEEVTFINGTPDQAFAHMNFWNGQWGFDGVWTRRHFIVEIPCNEASVTASASACNKILGVFNSGFNCAKFTEEGKIEANFEGNTGTYNLFYDNAGNFSGSVLSSFTANRFVINNNQIEAQDDQGNVRFTQSIDPSLVQLLTAGDNYFGLIERGLDRTYYLTGAISNPPLDPEVTGSFDPLGGTDEIYLYHLDQNGNLIDEILLTTTAYSTIDYYFQNFNDQINHIQFKGLISMADNSVTVYIQNNTINNINEGYSYEVGNLSDEPIETYLGTCFINEFSLEVSEADCNLGLYNISTRCDGTLKRTTLDNSVVPARIISEFTFTSSVASSTPLVTNARTEFPLPSGKIFTAVSISSINGSSTQLTIVDSEGSTLDEFDSSEIETPIIDVFENQDGSYSILSYSDNQLLVTNTNCMEEEMDNENDCSENVEGFTYLGELEGQQYFISEQIENWSAAQSISEENGGYLVSINTSEENDFLLDQIDEIVLIGLTDQSSEGNLNWADGSNLTFNNIEENNSINEDFGHMNFWNGAWSFDGQFTRRKFILERTCDSSLQNPDNTIIERSLEESVDHIKVESVYPNPTADNLFLPIHSKEKGDVKLIISNTIGENLLTKTFNLDKGENNVELETRNFPQGIYFIKMTLGTEVYSQKFMKQ